MEMGKTMTDSRDVWEGEEMKLSVWGCRRGEGGRYKSHLINITKDIFMILYT